MLRSVYFLFVLCLTLSGTLAAQFTERLNFNAKFEPASGVLHGVGQNEEYAFANYVARMDEGRFPAIFMTYIPVRADSARLARTITELKDMARYYPPELAFQIGISMTTGSPPNNSAYTEAINNGDWDANIDLIARSLDSLDRDIFLRIGYEANGFWNGYSAASYRPAFRRVAERFRAVSDRFATVWCTHPITSLSDMMTYYPGDDVVDWWSIDWFQPSFMNNRASADFLAEATRHDCPVMIGESTPTEIGLGDGQTSWDRWYGQFFQLIRDNPGIKAFCYINRDWTQISSLPSWGNALLEHDTTVLRLYREEMDSDLYVHLTAGPTYRCADLAPNAALTLSSATPDAAGTAGPLLTNRAETDGDTTVSYVRFSLASLTAADSVRTVKLWLAGRNQSAADIPYAVQLTSGDWTTSDLTYANRPAATATVGDILINDNRRNRLYWLDVTDLARTALAEGRNELTFLLGAPPVANNTFSIHGTERTDGYAPALQVVFSGDENPVSTGAVPEYRELRVFPNPSSGRVQLAGPEGPATVTVSDSAGRVLDVLNLRSTREEVDLTGLTPGVYFLLVRGRRETYVGRVVLR